MFYYVFKTLNGLYVEEKICNIYNIGNKEDKKIINGINTIKCSEEEINNLEKNTSNKFIKTIPNYVSTYELELEKNYMVYIDKKDNDSLYIKNNLCEEYNITPISKVINNMITYCKVTNDDLNLIEEKGKNKNQILKRKYINIELNDDNKEKTLFIYYHDMVNDKLYIDRRTFEQTRKYNIEIEGIPKIIENNNCYTITSQELKEFEEKSSSHGIELHIYKKYKEKNQKNDNYETIIIYKDCKNNKLYIEKAKSNHFNTQKTILNKECYEISKTELENNTNKKYIIVDVFTYNPIEYSFIVCNCNNDIYISQRTIQELNINTLFTKKIRVNNEIFQKNI